MLEGNVKKSSENSNPGFLIKYVKITAGFLLPIFSTLYILWLQYTALLIYFRRGNFPKLFVGFLLLAGFIILLVSTYQKTLRILYFLMTIIFVVIGGFYMLFPTSEVVDIAVYKDNTYYLTAEHWDIFNSNYSQLSIYECKKGDLVCSNLPGGLAYKFGAKLLTDKANDEISIVNNQGNLIYSYRNHPRYYSGSTQMGNLHYYITYWFLDTESSKSGIVSSIYVCQKKPSTTYPSYWR